MANLPEPNPEFVKFQSPVNESVPGSDPEKGLVRVHWFDRDKEPVGSILARWGVAALCALAFNMTYFFALPGVALTEEASGVQKSGEQEFDLQLVEAEEEQRYVEANPDAPENEPDRTNQFSDRAQQAAQENQVGDTPSPTPFVDGEEVDSQKIKEGSMPVEPSLSQPVIESVQGGQSSQGQPASADSEPSPEQPLIQTMPKVAPPPPTPEFIDEVEEQDEGGVEIPIIRKNSEDPDPDSTREDEKTVNVNIPPSVAQLLSEFQQELPEVDQPEGSENARPQPMPRPRLSPDVLPGPLMASQNYAASMGITAIDARFSQFGFYLKQMFDTIQLQWYSLLANVTIGQENRPARVDVEFVLTSEGRVDKAEVLDTNAGQLATLLCKDAIESRSPFGPWTEQMVASMGDETTIRIRFIYY